MTARWSTIPFDGLGTAQATPVVAGNNIRIRAESEEERPCWHAFSVKVERAINATDLYWQITLVDGTHEPITILPSTLVQVEPISADACEWTHCTQVVHLYQNNT